MIPKDDFVNGLEKWKRCYKKCEVFGDEYFKESIIYFLFFLLVNLKWLDILQTQLADLIKWETTGMGKENLLKAFER